MYSSTTAAVLQQKQHIQHPTHRPTHARTHHVKQRSRDVQQQHASPFMQTVCSLSLVMLLHRVGISMFFPCFYDPPPNRGPGTAPVDAPRSPLDEFGIGARSFAGDPEGCCAGRAWRESAVAGGLVAHGGDVPKRGILKQA